MRTSFQQRNKDNDMDILLSNYIQYNCIDLIENA